MKRLSLRKPPAPSGRHQPRLDQPGTLPGATDGHPPSDDNIYVLRDDDAEAKAFDAFYEAYDDVHDKTRKFLLG